jgi:hypothetical protein
MALGHAYAQEAPFGDRFSVEGDLGANLLMKKNGDGDYKDNLSLRGFEVKFTGKIAENIRLVIKTMLDRELRKDGANVSSDFDLENFIKEAYIKIDNVGGQPIAFVVGKHEIAFGQNHAGMPMYHNNPVYDLAKQDQVIGFTVALNYNLFGLVDSVEASVFETEAGDLSIGDVDGVSIRLTKALSKKITLEVSGMHKGNGDAEEEQRLSVGLLYRSGSWTAWAEGLYLKNNEAYPDSDFALTGGVSKEMGPGTLTVESTWIQDSLLELGLGYKLYITENVMVGPELRYTVYDGDDLGDGELVFGARTEVTFGKKPAKKYLFGPKKKPNA